MEFQRSSGGTSGAWAKASEIESGTKVKLITEAIVQVSDFGPQTVVKARFQGQDEAMNVRLNKPTVNGLIDAFGKDSKSWIGNVLTAHTEKALVSGKRVTILYLIPEGSELSETGEGFLTITKKLKMTAPKSVRNSPPVETEEAPLPEDNTDYNEEIKEDERW